MRALVRMVVDVRHHVTSDTDALTRDVRTVLTLVLLHELAVNNGRCINLVLVVVVLMLTQLFLM